MISIKYFYISENVVDRIQLTDKIETGIPLPYWNQWKNLSKVAHFKDGRRGYLNKNHFIISWNHKSLEIMTSHLFPYLSILQKSPRGSLFLNGHCVISLVKISLLTKVWTWTHLTFHFKNKSLKWLQLPYFLILITTQWSR